MLSLGGGLKLTFDLICQNKTSKCLKITHYKLSPHHCHHYGITKLSLLGKDYTYVIASHNVFFALLRPIFALFLSYLSLLLLGPVIIKYVFIFHEIFRAKRHIFPLLRKYWSKLIFITTLSKSPNVVFSSQSAVNTLLKSHSKHFPSPKTCFFLTSSSSSNANSLNLGSKNEAIIIDSLSMYLALENRFLIPCFPY